MKAGAAASGYPAHLDQWQRPVGLWTLVTTVMRRQPVWISILVPVLLTLGMGWVDDLTGWEISLFILYAAPIILAVWWDGAAAGLFISALSAGVWWFANIDTHPYASTWGYA